jgi:hypothetical protein
MVVLSTKGVIMDTKEQTKNMTSEDRKNIVKEVINEAACFTPPIENAPYINVMFCKQPQGWTAFFGYGADLDPQTSVKFIHCICDAADLLNGKEE